jgi:PAS domain S-box-containing protein
MNRALIVDDNLENRYLLHVLLQGNGYQVEEASHGAEALAKARQSTPALIISDLLMPVMDGYSFLKQCKADEQLKVVPFVVYTATYTDPKDERLALSLGADAFIVKPLEPEPFIRRIREVVAMQGRGELPLNTEVQTDEHVILKQYNEALVRKLEAKLVQLEQANQALRQDVAQRQQVEAALRLRDRAIQAVSQGILIADACQADNPIVYASPSFEKLTGYASSEILGRNCRFLQGKDTDAAARDQIRAAIRAVRSCSVELLNYRKDGTTFWNHLTIAPVFDDAGRATHFVGVQTDVTERRRLEEQFRQAQKMEAVGQLAGGVAHDFNNLLTIITGFSDLILYDLAADDKARAYVQEILKAVERSSALIRQLLAYSRRQVVVLKVLDLNTVIRGADKMLQRIIGDDIQLETSLAENLGAVRADVGQLEQVLLNLAINARDAMPSGGKLTIETCNIDLDDLYVKFHLPAKAGPHVLLAVSDNGCGMTPEIKARIFEPFFTTKTPGKGTGLGLATTQGIVSQLDGHIEVYSEVDNGTSFKIYLPRVSTPARPEAGKVDAQPVLGGTESVLLVEDDPLLRGLLHDVLAQRGYAVTVACNGKDALQVAANHRGTFDIIVTDVVMPDLGGRQMVEQLIMPFPNAKVLYLSGYTDDAVVRHGILHDRMPFLQKPFGSAALLRKVREVFDS